MLSDKDIEREQARAEEALERRDQKMEERCGNCRFWEKDNDYTEENEGWCRRYPPQLSEFGEDGWSNGCNSMSWAFPRMTRTCWCGEWQPAREPERQD